MKLFDVYPLNNITINRAQGSYVWDDNGVQYLDMYGGHAVISIGHTHPHWVKSIEAQLEKIAFYSNSIIIPLQQALANKLGLISGKTDYQLFLCNSGAEANENALKLASFHTGRKKVIAFTKSFHGRTSLAVAATDNKAIVAPVNETDNIIFLPFNDEAALDACFKAYGSEIAAVIIEGIQGVGGIVPASISFLKLVRSLCDQYGSVYIADSVQCGYGRTGQFFAHDIAEVNADIYSMAKGMGNGFPIGGILIAPHIQSKHGMLGTTFGGNHLACAAALAVLEVMEEENLINMAKQRGMYLMNQLKAIEGIENVRGRGLMIGFDVPENLKGLKKLLLEQYNIFTGEAKPNVIRLLPSLALSRKQADEFLEALKEAILEIKTNAE
ncbi:MAG: aspartate aminotransferase family protein [Sphingobacteriia bacterium 24-36-13]|jgi:acetylornithine aminotransferase|uniref:aspartate aminotransferase family protein n=1 Tax=Sediminibacterium sp. TaxID=1917865 RepID=UPI000BD09C0C|nr:aminotransferase class III-fold pyridoxal phosphate-dependent enzyme [Sediminibacterium sp.]OYY10514.1 MAG: aspartate aminotransferase family protein [Sphingobacteriia bacterium 35-36-14]OYZ52609.1 MAG: aspartate aminotransferase family protein [Sphingobacteriia bacterium 24-36-13]OZA63956.1 MAG: aspartate aminotransferase family protein [Sphingobacteriia bacterium 39-36-14]HQS25433.1 aminotransferase class III-fold pyridoxal phosphate-dependent enzyme [Sediminibacterium sp.]HQS35770.1 amin